MREVTRILQSCRDGDCKAGEELLPLVYDELRKLAAIRMASEADPSTLQPTALVHEAWLRLAGSGPQDWQSRGHFFGAAAEAMRRILIDNARRKQTKKRGARAKPIDLDEVDLAVEADEDLLLLIQEALEKLAAEDPRSAELVKLRFYTGLSYEEAGQVLGISERSAKRSWAFARAWLYRELSRQEAEG